MEATAGPRRAPGPGSRARRKLALAAGVPSWRTVCDTRSPMPMPTALPDAPPPPAPSARGRPTPPRPRRDGAGGLRGRLAILRERLRADPARPPRVWMRQQWLSLLGLALLIAAIVVSDTWLYTCGFQGCPSAVEIRAF